MWTECPGAFEVTIYLAFKEKDALYIWSWRLGILMKKCANKGYFIQDEFLIPPPQLCSIHKEFNKQYKNWLRFEQRKCDEHYFTGNSTNASSGMISE